MNAWDAFTWLSSVALAASAVWIFWFFLRDVRSILNREMHGHDEDEDHPATSEATPGSAPPAPPEDLPR
jgi:hypothetical protein